jgi:hypothetical protein
MTKVGKFSGLTLLDSGASVNVISEKKFKTLQASRKDKYLTFPIEHCLKLTSLTKQKINANTFTIIPMYDHHLIKFYILKNLDHDLVFGLPALAALNAKIDFGKTKEKLVLARNEIPIIHKVPLHTHDSISSVNSGTLDDVLLSKYETEYPNVFFKRP